MRRYAGATTTPARDTPTYEPLREIDLPRTDLLLREDVKRLGALTPAAYAKRMAEIGYPNPGL